MHRQRLDREREYELLKKEYTLEAEGLGKVEEQLAEKRKELNEAQSEFKDWQQDNDKIFAENERLK